MVQATQLPFPTCAIKLYFNDKELVCDTKDLTSQEPDNWRFSYRCTSSAQGWHVLPGGSIQPPSVARIIQISLDCFARNHDLEFGGLQFAKRPGEVMGSDIAGLHGSAAEALPPWSIPPDLGICVTSPDGPPPVDGSNFATRGPLSITIEPPVSPQEPKVLHYNLAIKYPGHPCLIWDDPKIYDDGTG